MSSKNNCLHSSCNYCQRFCDWKCWGVKNRIFVLC